MTEEQIMSKLNTADPAKVAEVEANCTKHNPKARTIRCSSRQVPRPALLTLS